MKKVLPDRLEAGRVLTGEYASDPSWGAYGHFYLHGPCGEMLAIIASGADDDDPMAQGWEHVSVSTRRRTPNWPEMCFVKDLFWEPDETVLQYHPPRSEYVNNHPHCLHLWKPKKVAIPLPPSILVGRVAHGVPARVDRLRSLGNAVVPQIPEIIGRAIMRSALTSAQPAHQRKGD